MTKIRFLPAAEAEFLKVIEYYSNVREGSGIRFQSVMAAVSKASENPFGGARPAKARVVAWSKAFLSASSTERAMSNCWLSP